MTPRPLCGRLCALLGLLWGCEAAPAPDLPTRHAPMQPQQAAAFQPSDGKVAPAKDEATVWSGAGAVERGPVEVLAEERGLVFERQRWRYEGMTGWAWRVRVKLPGRPSVRAARAVVELARVVGDPPAGPWAAINGGFYEDRAGEMAPMGVVLSAGELAHPYKKRGGSGVFALVDGQPRIIHRDGWPALAARKPAHALQSIDRIVSEGRSLVTRREGAGLAARSAVALSDDQLWLVALAADGSITEQADGARLRATGWQGLPLWGFAEYLIDTTGAVEALNLDGAVSTQLLVSASGKTWRIIGERGTLNALVVEP